MENQPQTEDVANGTVLLFHIFYIYDLGSDIARCATPHEQVLLGLGELGKTEIRDNAL